MLVDRCTYHRRKKSTCMMPLSLVSVHTTQKHWGMVGALLVLPCCLLWMSTAKAQSHIQNAV